MRNLVAILFLSLLFGCKSTVSNPSIIAKIITEDDAFLCQYKGPLFSSIRDNYSFQSTNIEQAIIDASEQASMKGANAITIDTLTETGANSVSLTASAYNCKPNIINMACGNAACSNVKIQKASIYQRKNYKKIPYKITNGYKITEIKNGVPASIYEDKNMRHWDISFKPASTFRLEQQIDKALGKKVISKYIPKSGEVIFDFYYEDIGRANTSNFEIIIENLNGTELSRHRGGSKVATPEIQGEVYYTTHWWNQMNAWLNIPDMPHSFKVFIYNHSDKVQAEWLVEKQEKKSYCLFLDKQRICGFSKAECKLEAKNNYSYCEVEL